MSANNGFDGSKPTWISEHIPAEIAADIFTFKVKLINGNSITVNMANDIEVDYEKLEEQLDECPGQYVWWASVYSEAKAMVSLLERRLSMRRGVLTETAVKTARDAGGKLTDKQVAAIIESDETLNKWEVQLIQLQKNVGKLWHLVKTVEMKSEHLRSRSGFKRKEREQLR